MQASQKFASQVAGCPCSQSMDLVGGKRLEDASSPNDYVEDGNQDEKCETAPGLVDMEKRL